MKGTSINIDTANGLHPASPPMLLVFAFVYTPMAMAVGAWSIMFPWLLPLVFGAEEK